MPQNKQIHLDNRPQGEATASNFKLVTAETPALAGRPGAGAPPFPEPGPVHARAHERCQELRRAAAAGPGHAGRHGRRGGREPLAQVPGRRQGGRHGRLAGIQRGRTRDQPGALRKVDTTHVPLSHYLGAVGMPGVTAWYGLVKIIEPKAGQTVVVSAAVGRRGQRVRRAGQGARLPRRGHCRRRRTNASTSRTNSASTPASTTSEHKDAASLSKALKEACPDGIDGYFENVGGMVLDAVMTAHERLRPHRAVRDDRRLRRRSRCR